MILIHSRPSSVTTIEVIRWLISMGKDFVRLNFHQDFPLIYELIESRQIESLYFHGKGLLPQYRFGVETELRSQIEEDLNNDSDDLVDAIFSDRHIRRRFGNDHTEVNKIIALKAADEIGLKIPRFRIVTVKSDLQQLKRDWGRIICKSIGDGVNIHTEKVIIDGQRTEEIEEEHIHKFPESFYPTMVQELITGFFEVRVFCYSDNISAIATFCDGKDVDIRKNDSMNQRRKVPFKPTEELKQKSKQLLNVLNLSYGSFDFLVTSELEYYFLEVNPYGQYGYLSKIGNYNLEHQIANYL